MSYDEALHLLLNHASLANDLPEERCLSVLLYWLRANKGDLGIDAALREVIECLKVVNCELNGRTPSDVVWADKARLLSRELVYAVSSLILDSVDQLERMRQSSNELDRRPIRNALAELAIAWDAVLAGDIDDLEEHVRLEKLALGL